MAMSRSIRYGLSALGLLLALTALVLIVQSLMKPGAVQKKHVVQQIQLVKPPPPPPPPKEQPRPPEIKPREEVKLNEPPPPVPQAQQAQNEPPPSASLGVDAQGGAGSDGFGLVGRPGGRDITTLGKEGGPGGGVSRVAFASYTNLLQQRIQEEISRNQQLRGGDYRAVVRVWLGRDGAVQRVELVGTSGDPERDRLIRTSLAEMAPLREPPPENMPQPVRLRITSRSTG